MTETDAAQDLGAFEQADGIDINLPTASADVETERQHRKERLAAALRTIGHLRLAEGVAGHITARDPEHLDSFWVNPFGMNFKHITVSDLIMVNESGEVVVGSKPVNTAAFAIHAAIHEARPDVVAACHTHSMYGKTFSTLGRELKMISQDTCMFYNDVAYHADSGGAIVVDKADGANMAESLGDKKALVHQNHGLITVGGSVDSAAWWFIALERACQSQLVAEAVAEPIEVPAESAQFTYDQSGHDLAGWFQFQPFYDEAVRNEPELLT